MQLHKEKILLLAILAALGCGLMGGLLFAFSNFVMTALSRQPAGSGVRTMQAINIYILNPLFILVFFGTAVVSLVLAVVAIVCISCPGSSLLLAGSALYLIGAVGVTIIFNVPLNNRLSVLNPDTAKAADYWLIYLSEWVRWNHIRTIASVTAAALLTWAIRQLACGAE
jgi:uncharacterized membrane protein